MARDKFLFSSFTVFYFLAGFVNIHFAGLALLCMGTPFVLLVRNKKNLWCRGICPRRDYFSLFKFMNVGLKVPRWLVSFKMKNILFTYFCFNLMLIGLSTVFVSQGQMSPIDRVRLFIFFQIPLEMPQLFSFQTVNPVFLHLSYRFYSLMLSSVILGTILAVLFKPATWCVICPVNTLSQRYIDHLS
ncbi:hypothetical protein EXM22_08890 [Oceanispirochaeta crateris]|uniref:4Fe-4S ferredoxin-type domain-containing protein n=1 Tax=Oceanispirochaeta crateris TaxID=2518645 RepID=A0A5C1QIU2_9SPIO|nr:4Fe-4S binding protein [Oceanispirochaeta crateris]QEN08095.1 hypothetical protein EXM22_08890 [Oceanispirochaeta crateris]